MVPNHLSLSLSLSLSLALALALARSLALSLSLLSLSGRCLFGTTTLTVNEESFFLKNVHKANLNTDGALNVGLCTLHSAEMLSGGFNWIFFGFVIDLVLEWKPTFMNAITDAVCVYVCVSLWQPTFMNAITYAVCVYVCVSLSQPTLVNAITDAVTHPPSCSPSVRLKNKHTHTEREIERGPRDVNVGRVCL
jgi:hypothetical protein